VLTGVSDAPNRRSTYFERVCYASAVKRCKISTGGVYELSGAAAAAMGVQGWVSRVVWMRNECKRGNVMHDAIAAVNTATLR